MTWNTAERPARRQGAVVTGPRAARRSAPRLGLSLLATAFACAAVARAAGAPPDACALLTAADVERVQGGSLREAISSSSGGSAGAGNAAEAVAGTQCFFRVDPFLRSVSLALTRAGRGAAARRELHERWERTLHPRHPQHPMEQQGQGTERERDRAVQGTDRDRDRDRGEVEPSVPLTPVAGLGEEAFLAGGHGNVSLYVLAPGAFLRLSVGGPGEAADWSRRAQALARAALARLEARPARPPRPPATR